MIINNNNLNNARFPRPLSEKNIDLEHKKKIQEAYRKDLEYQIQLKNQE